MARINGTVGKNNYLWYADITERIPDDYLTTNKTIVDYVIWIQNNGTRFSSNGWTKRTRIDGKDVWAEDNANITTTLVGYNEAVGIMRGSKEIDHNADGKKRISVEAFISKSSYGTYDPGYCYLYGEIDLTTIPRTSSVTCTDGNIESSVSININRASDSFTHTLRYAFGSLSGTIATGVGTSYGWTLPTSFYAQIPNAKSGVGTVYCDTYSGTTLIGTSSCNFTAYTDESKCKPTVTATIVDSNSTTVSLTGDNNKLVKFVSNAKVTINATAKNSSSISSRSVSCGDGKSGSGTEVTLNKVESGNFTVSATDSRGYTTSITISKTLINYVNLTLNHTFYRPEPTTGEVKLQLSGNYFNGSFGATNNSLTVKYRYKESGGTYGDYQTVAVTITNNTYSLNLSLGTGFDYQKSYDFEIVATDKLNTVTKTAHVSEGIPMLALFKAFIEMFGITAFQISDDGTTLIINGDIKISGSNKLLKNL